MPHKGEEEKKSGSQSSKKAEAEGKKSQLSSGSVGGQDEELEKKIEELSAQETDELVSSFKKHFETCTKACKKPNILIAGITGAGKSTLVNSVFGESLAKAGVGMPVTQHFQKFEPEDKPVVIYDSKGLEWSEHEAFIKETGKFFTDLRKKNDVADHIHIVWYCVNTARGRFESFEADLVRNVFAPTPVIFVLNKCDLADAKQMKAIKKVIEDEKLENNKGIHICISSRENWTQSWCPDCLSDDVIYDEETKELECSDCGYTSILKENYGMKKLINETVKLLPELAKDAFMFSQTASLSEKDKRAKDIVKEFTKEISLDLKGDFIKKVAEMCAKLFVIWGWPLTANTFKEGLAQMQSDYLKQLKLRERIAAAALDKIFGISKSFSGLIGMTMNRGMKKLNERLISHAAKNSLDNVNIQDFMDEADIGEQLIRMFFEEAMVKGVEQAIDKFWDLSNEELEEIAQHLPPLDQSSLFGNLQEFDEKQLTDQYNALVDESEVSIGEVDIEDDENTTTTTTTTTTTKTEEKQQDSEKKE